MNNVISPFYLLPAAMFASKNPFVVSTLLGSCVSVCLYDQKHQFGGINHFLLPRWNGEGVPSPKYGDIAIKFLIQRMLNLGSKKENLVAKVFGGAEIIGTTAFPYKIGNQNIRLAFSVLSSEKITIVAKHVGGRKAMQLRYYTKTGGVKVRIHNGSIS